MIAIIPAPPFSEIPLGFTSIHLYGVLIAVAALVAVLVTEKRWVARGGSGDDVTAIALWAVPAGIIGARAYHVITDNQLYRAHPIQALELWDGGLGIWGGIGVGTAVGVWQARRRGLNVLALMDATAPALVLAQAIGRLGNYFNQELFGRPTNLPWGLFVDPEYRPNGYETFATFHPTFLYELIGNVAICALLLTLSRFSRSSETTSGTRKPIRIAPGVLFSLYVGLYCMLRLLVEQLRIDPAHIVGGVRLNTWTCVIGIVGAAVAIAMLQRRSKQRSQQPKSPES